MGNITPASLLVRSEPQSYQFWANVMLTISNTSTPSPDLICILPDDDVTAHSTGAGLADVGRAADAIRHLAERLFEAGARVSEMRVCGGQPQSASWNQIKADVTGFLVAVPQVVEAALMGAAVLAGVGAGLVPDITAGANQMVRINSVLEPDPKRQQHYTRLYRVYECLYPDLCDAFHQLDEITRQ